MSPHACTSGRETNDPGILVGLEVMDELGKSMWAKVVVDVDGEDLAGSEADVDAGAKQVVPDCLG